MAEISPFDSVAKRVEDDNVVEKSKSPFEGFAKPVETPGVMPFVNKPIADLLSFLPEALAEGISYIPGVDIRGKPTEYIRKGFEAIGAPLPEEGREPETIPEHIGAGVGEISSLLVPGGLAVKGLARGAGVAGKITSNILRSMAKHPYLTMTSELTGGAGIGVGRGVAEEVFPESPTVRAAAEMAAGLVGGMAPTIVLHSPSAVALRGGKTLLRRISMPFTKKGSKFRAGEHVKGLVAKPEEVIPKIGEETIGDLPPAIQAGEKRLTTLYKSLIGQDPVADAESVEALSKSIIKLEKEMRKLGYGAPDLLAEITEKRVANIELNMDNRIATAMGKAQDKLDVLPVAQRRGHESRIVRNEIETVMRQEKLAEQKLWADVSKDFEVGFEKTRQTFSSIVDDLAKAQKSDIPDPLRRNPIIVDDKLEITNLREMQGLRSKLLEVSRKARKNSQWNKARIADNVADAILEDLGIAASATRTPEAASLLSALAATRQFKIRFQQGIMGEILGYGRSGVPSISPDLTLDISIGRMGQRGSIDIGKIAITPDAVEATKRYLSRSYTDYALDKTTGKINPIRSETWIKNNEAILDNFPDLQNQMRDIAKAQELANNTRIAMVARKKALRDPKISVSARFLNAVDMDRTVDSIFKAKNPSRNAHELVLQARKDPSGEALEGLKGGVIDHILEKSSIGAFNELGEQTLSGRTLLNFVNRNRLTLQHLFDQREIARMQKIGSELAKIETFEKTAWGKPEIEMKDFASNALRLFSRVSGAQAGRVVAGVTGGGTVQTPGIFSERFRAFANFLTKNRAEEMIHDAILSKDPRLLQSLLLPLGKPESPNWKNLIILNRRMNLWLLGTGKRVMEDINEEIESDKQLEEIQTESLALQESESLMPNEELPPEIPVTIEPEVSPIEKALTAGPGPERAEALGQIVRQTIIKPNVEGLLQ